jgi:hypothetical protein
MDEEDFSDTEVFCLEDDSLSVNSPNELLSNPEEPSNLTVKQGLKVVDAV